MSSQILLDALPDLAVLLQRDGVLLSFGGGRSVPTLTPAQGMEGKNIAAFWPAPMADLIKQLVRRALANRQPAEAEFEHEQLQFEARIAPQGPDRALCLIRALSAVALRAEARSAEQNEPSEGQFDRRGFLRRLKQSLAMAALNERPLAVAMVRVDGVSDIARIIDAGVSDQVISAALQRLPRRFEVPGATEIAWYMGQLGENLLVVVFECSKRDLIEECVGQLCQSLREPVPFGDAVFHLIPYAGVAVLGLDAASPKTLLDHARAAVTEARRAEAKRAFFFSDTLKLRSLARIDIARELQDAMTNGQIRLRYTGRHELITGRLSALHAHVQWVHPLRGEVRPAEFLGVAETTGLAAALSRYLLERLREDCADIKLITTTDVRVSFGALRHHVLSANFRDDIEGFLAAKAIGPQRFELRIAERSYVTQDAGTWRALADLGVQLTVDEVGRRMSSLDHFARGPLWGVQLDRAWVTALGYDETALKVCRAGIAMAHALGLTSIATGVDDARQRDALINLGCQQGLGDLFNATASAVSASPSPMRRQSNP